MKVKFILPALVEATNQYWRSIKYSLFPPLGLATLAGFLSQDDSVEIQDEHVEKLHLDDEPDMVVIQVYITSAYRAYEIADLYRSKGVYVVLGGLHTTALPNEAKLHADTIFLGPGDDTWPQFLEDFKIGHPKKTYRSVDRSLSIRNIRRDLIKRHLYLVPNSIVTSRGCPNNCDFCYKQSFFDGGDGFYTAKVDEVLQEIETMPGKHLFFLDDHLFANAEFACELFEGMRGMERLWQAAGTVTSVLNEKLLEKAVRSGLRSLFVGFETLNQNNLKNHNKHQNLQSDYQTAICNLRNSGVMINGSFIFGMDNDDSSVFERTVDWAIENSIETATFHILTPYPGTKLYKKMLSNERILTNNWDLYDTRHVVYRPSKMTPQMLEEGYWKAYEKFYRWKSIFASARQKDSLIKTIRHLAYTGGWKKCDPLWNLIIKAKKIKMALPLLESNLSGFGCFSKMAKEKKMSAVHLLENG